LRVILLAIARVIRECGLFRNGGCGCVHVRVPTKVTGT
jgi:hypothetical protein